MKKVTINTLTSIFVGLLFSANAQIISTVAGNGIAGFSGNGGVATSAKLNNPTGIAFDALGNMYISDYNNHQIRKVDLSGNISTVVGTGTSGYSGDGGAATAAKLSLPSTLIFDNSGNMLIVDAGNGCIRKVTPTGIISTIAGTGINDYSGDGGLATNAKLSFPCGVCIDGSGNIYIADRNNHRIRKVNTSGIISTFAGTGTGSYGGDGGPATAANLNMPNGINFDSYGNAFIADAYNNRIRKVNTSGVISTIAGTGTAGSAGDGGNATSAQLNKPFGVTIDAAGNYYISDFSNYKLRKIDQAGIISTIAGTGSAGYSGDGGLSTNAKINSSEKVTIDANGYIYLPDAGNHRVRKISCDQPTIIAISSNSLICSGESVNLNASGASTYSWSNGNSGASITVSPSITTTYSVTGTNSVTGCRNTVTITQDVSACIGVKELDSEHEFIIFPNPFKNKLIILSTGTKQTIQLFNSLGEIIYNSNIENGKTEIDLDKHACGVYFIRIGNTSRKLIKE